MSKLNLFCVEVTRQIYVVAVDRNDAERFVDSLPNSEINDYDPEPICLAHIANPKEVEDDYLPIYTGEAEKEICSRSEWSGIGIDSTVKQFMDRKKEIESILVMNLQFPLE